MRDCQEERTAGDKREERKRTLFDGFDGLDEVVDERLKVAERVGDAGCLVDLSEGSVEDGDDVLEELGRRTLTKVQRAVQVSLLSLPDGRHTSDEHENSPRRSTQPSSPFPSTSRTASSDGSDR
jgi:hypothetical protein